MWDQRFGGFYWEVDSLGNFATKHHKHLYGQAFALYALSEYARASGDSSAEELAQKLFGLLEYNAHDERYGGYQEFFRCDWGTAPVDVKGYLNTAPTIKLMNTHLHLMEGIAAYHSLTNDLVARERLIELILVHSNAFVRKRTGACTDRYQRDWTPLLEGGYDRVSYGHDLENVWLLMEACQTGGIAGGPLLDLYRSIFAYALQYGFDSQRGGFYDTGLLNRPADRRDKVWWVQAEALVSALYMYRLTREPLYLECFTRTLEWIMRYQADWEHGEWHARIGRSGKPKEADKAGPWKAPYHSGRATLKGLELLSSIMEP